MPRNVHWACMGSKHARIWRSAAADEAVRFLRRHDLFNNDCKTAVRHLRSGQPVIRVSHQPNLFAGLNIMGLLIVAEQLAMRHNATVVFVSIDYDDAGDQRFRSALLPGTHSAAPVHLKGGVPRALRGQPGYAVPKPSWPTVQDWYAQHLQAIQAYKKRFGLSVPPSALPLRDIYLSAHSFADFNLAVIAYMARSLVKVPVLFVPASQCLPAIGDDVNLLIRHILHQRADDAERLVWRVCPGCSQRRPANLTLRNGTVWCYWECPVCSLRQNEPLQWQAVDGKEHADFIPRVFLCDSIDQVIIRAEHSVSYRGGTAHLEASRIWLREQQQAPLPEHLWSPAHLGFIPDALGFDSEQWNRGRFSALVYRDIFGGDSVRRNVRASMPRCLTLLD